MTFGAVVAADGLHNTIDRIGGAWRIIASWFETRRFAALLTMRLAGTRVKKAFILRRPAWRAVSKSLPPDLIRGMRALSRARVAS